MQFPRNPIPGGYSIDWLNKPAKNVCDPSRKAFNARAKAEKDRMAEEAAIARSWDNMPF